MGRVEFDQENKAPTVNYDYPKLKLKSGERARIIVGLESPVMEYVHTLRKPQIVNGVPVTYMAERKDGTKYEDYKMDFVGRPICLGDANILKEKGIDAKNCPACALAAQSTDYTQAPQRRYAMHVVRYRTKGGTDKIATPFSVEVLVWSFTDKVFNKLVDLKDDFGGDLRKHDIVLGPCTNETFQQFDITPSLQSEWLTDKKRKALVVETFKEGQIPDLTIACGSVKQKQWVQQDVDTILEVWAEVKGVEKNAESLTDLDEDLSTLLDEDGDDKDSEGWSKSSGDDDLDDLLGGDDKDDDSDDSDDDDSNDSDDDDLDALMADEDEKPKAKAKAKASPAKAEKPAAKKAKKEEPQEEAADADEFEDLLADLD